MKCWRHGWLLAAALLMGGTAHAQQPGQQQPEQQQPPPEERFAQAMVAYERCHWAQAYAAFMRLGEEGHTEAARVATQMRRYGRVLYRMDFIEGSTQHAQVRR